MSKKGDPALPSDRDDSADWNTEHTETDQHEDAAHLFVIQSDKERTMAGAAPQDGHNDIDESVNEETEEDETLGNNSSELEPPKNYNLANYNRETTSLENIYRIKTSSAYPHAQPTRSHPRTPTSKPNILREIVDLVKRDPTQLANTTFRLFVKDLAEQCLREGVGSVEDRYHHLKAASDLKFCLRNAWIGGSC